MVMEFTDVVMNVDNHEINASHWKQFSEASSLSAPSAVTPQLCYCVGKVVAGLWLFCFPPLVSLQVEAAWLERRPDGDIQRGLQCVISAGAVRGVQTECGAPLLSFGGIWEPCPGAPHS